MRLTVGGEVQGWANDVFTQCSEYMRREWADRAIGTEASSQLFAILRFASAATVLPKANGNDRMMMRLVVYALADFAFSKFDDWVVEIYAVEEQIDAPPLLYRGSVRPVSKIDPGEQCATRASL